MKYPIPFDNFALFNFQGQHRHFGRRDREIDHANSAKTKCKIKRNLYVICDLPDEVLLLKVLELYLNRNAHEGSNIAKSIDQDNYFSNKKNIEKMWITVSKTGNMLVS